MRRVCLCEIVHVRSARPPTNQGLLLRGGGGWYRYMPHGPPGTPARGRLEHKGAY